MSIEEIVEHLESMYRFSKSMAESQDDVHSNFIKDAIALDYAIMVVKRDLKARQPK